jgi:hypothetical protein
MSYPNQLLGLILHLLTLKTPTGLTYNELNENIQEIINTIPKSYYKNILKGTYNKKDYMKKKIVRKYKMYKDS